MTDNTSDKEGPNTWTDADLYRAYLLGCEDDCLPDPMTKDVFLLNFGGAETATPAPERSPDYWRGKEWPATPAPSAPVEPDGEEK